VATTNSTDQINNQQYVALSSLFFNTMSMTYLFPSPLILLNQTYSKIIVTLIFNKCHFLDFPTMSAHRVQAAKMELVTLRELQPQISNVK